MRRMPLLLLIACSCATTSPAVQGERDTSSRSAQHQAAAAGSAIAGSTNPSATALIEGAGATGNATLTTVGNDTVGVHLEIKGAKPGRHGVYIADKGGCNEAAGHYNPNRSAHHGGPGAAVRHAGDLGNIEVDAAGKGVLDVVVGDLSLASVANGVVNRALVVSEGADDLSSDPDGGAGGRAGCGLILAPLLSQP